VNSVYAFEGKLLKVRVDDVVLPGGKRTKREVVLHPGAVAIVAIDGGKVLLERQYRHAAGKVMWEIPAGTIEKGESQKQCALRELREETGFSAKSIEEILHFYVAVGYSTEVITLFVATGLEKNKASPEEDESIETMMVPLESALEMVERNEIEDAKTMIGLLLFAKEKNEALK